MDVNALKTAAIDTGAGIRTLLLRGDHYGCPCCEARFRHFTTGGRHTKAKTDGYCPRCNSKPRHRWLWLNRPDLLSDHGHEQTSVLHIAPSYSIHRALGRMKLKRYVTTGMGPSARYDRQLDLTDPTQVGGIGADPFDVVVCIHVLEHLDDDRAAIAGLARLVNPDGVVLVGVPIRHGETLEDPSITDPAERDAVFGEPDHRRWYGIDVVKRLQTVGFEVTSLLTGDVEGETRTRFGLKPGEGLFICRPKPKPSL